MNFSDKSLRNIRDGFSLSPYTNESADVLAASIKYLRLIPGHFPRHIEYPWIWHKLKDLRSGSRAVDVGAGISPIPILLAKCGVNVFTFDSSDIQRSWINRNDWNAWGYLDYSERFALIQSHNKIFEASDLPGAVDVVYSISVIEHTPKVARMNVWREAAKALAPGGRLLSTVDLEPGGKKIWNLNMGRVVEDPIVHGDVQVVREEIEAAGFMISVSEFIRNLPHSNVDIWLIEAVKKVEGEYNASSGFFQTASAADQGGKMRNRVRRQATASSGVAGGVAGRQLASLFRAADIALLLCRKE